MTYICNTKLSLIENCPIQLMCALKLFVYMACLEVNMETSIEDSNSNLPKLSL